MITLPTAIEQQVLAIAQAQHTTVDELVNEIFTSYFTKASDKSSSHSFADLLNDLPEFPSFKGKNPLALQQEMRDEWN